MFVSSITHTMITFQDIDKYITRAKIAAPAVDFEALKFFVSEGRLYKSEAIILSGSYSRAKSITLSSAMSKQRGFAVFLHELGHHLTWLQFGDFIDTFSEKEHELYADMFALEMAQAIGFDYERFIERKVGMVPGFYSSKLPALL